MHSYPFKIKSYFRGKRLKEAVKGHILADIWHLDVGLFNISNTRILNAGVADVIITNHKLIVPVKLMSQKMNSNNSSCGMRPFIHFFGVYLKKMRFIANCGS